MTIHGLDVFTTILDPCYAIAFVKGDAGQHNPALATTGIRTGFQAITACLRFLGCRPLDAEFRQIAVVRIEHLDPDVFTQAAIGLAGLRVGIAAVRIIPWTFLDGTAFQGDTQSLRQLTAKTGVGFQVQLLAFT